MRCIKQLALIILHKNLFKNKKSEDTTSREYPEINACHVDLSLIVLSLFVLSNYLSSWFIVKRADPRLYKKFYWKVLIECESKLPIHIDFMLKTYVRCKRLG